MVNSRRPPVPKPVSTKKKKSSSPPKGIDEAALAEKRQAQNAINRNFGKSVEREVAKRTGGVRVPGSGAIKGSVMALEGDVQVRTLDGKRVLALVECKGQSPKEGQKSFTIKVSVLKQAQDEAAIQRAIPIVWYHIKGTPYEEDWAMIPAKDVVHMLDTLKEVYIIETTAKQEEE